MDLIGIRAVITDFCLKLMLLHSLLHLLVGIYCCINVLHLQWVPSVCRCLGMESILHILMVMCQIFANLIGIIDTANFDLFSMAQSYIIDTSRF